ncbi:radical SAM protein [Vibrio ouci]|uniref:Radical SAM protein n=1 Tax=Vibrio ouci TaxID=2499078 RepID=A0A4Y8WBT6_9VIBR|nr:radical SAM protein [Vibrio ouci]TFH90257.1 radical SAM protein [Vibrio ouci]
MTESLHARHTAFQTWPITFNALVVEYTNRCNARCSMCYQYASPKGSEVSGRRTLRLGAIKKVIEGASELAPLTKHFLLTGGEPLLSLSRCVALFEHARHHGYPTISVTTNGFWGRDEEQAYTTVRAMRQAGLTHLDLSWDIWHLDYISPVAIDNVIAACHREGIAITLRVLTTQRHRIQEALGLLRYRSLTSVDQIKSGPVAKMGRATKLLPNRDFFSEQSAGDTCHARLQLTVNPKGNVSPCYCGSDQTQGLSFGNIYQDAIVDIYRRMNDSRLLRTLVFYGAGALVPLLREADIALGREDDNICKLCWRVFSDPHRSSALEHNFARRRSDDVKHLLSALGIQTIPIQEVKNETVPIHFRAHDNRTVVRR